MRLLWVHQFRHMMCRLRIRLMILRRLSEITLWVRLGMLLALPGLWAISILNCRSNNVQNSFEKKLGLNDETYTLAVDSGAYGNFVRDGAGYGLAQWTFWSRKEALLKFAKEKGKSIGDLQMQLDFLWKELKVSYPAVLTVL